VHPSCQTLGLMKHPVEDRRDFEARYRALQPGALVAFVVLLLAAILSNVLYPSSPWFLGASALGGVFVFTSWHLHALRPEASNVLYPVLGVGVSVLGLLTEIDRPMFINIACGFSVLGAVMFGLLETARRRESKDE